MGNNHGNTSTTKNVSVEGSKRAKNVENESLKDNKNDDDHESISSAEYEFLRSRYYENYSYEDRIKILENKLPNLTKNEICYLYFMCKGVTFRINNYLGFGEKYIKKDVKNLMKKREVIKVDDEMLKCIKMIYDITSTNHVSLRRFKDYKDQPDIESTQECKNMIKYIDNLKLNDKKNATNLAEIFIGDYIDFNNKLIYKFKFDDVYPWREESEFVIE